MLCSRTCHDRDIRLEDQLGIAGLVREREDTEVETFIDIQEVLDRPGTGNLHRRFAKHHLRIAVCLLRGECLGIGVVEDQLVVCISRLRRFIFREGHFACAELVAPCGIVVEHIVHHELHGHVADGPGIYHVARERCNALCAAVVDDRL